MTFACHDLLITFTRISINAFDNITPAPAGMLNTNDTISPDINAMNDITPEIITSERNPRATIFADTAGRIITPEIKSVPVILIPITTTRAVNTDTISWYMAVLIPNVFA